MSATKRISQNGKPEEVVLDEKEAEKLIKAVRRRIDGLQHQLDYVEDKIKKKKQKSLNWVSQNNEQIASEYDFDVQCLIKLQEVLLAMSHSLRPYCNSCRRQYRMVW
jgi:predicted secreted Zn-dependent protease